MPLTRTLLIPLVLLLLSGGPGNAAHAAEPAVRATGDLAVIIERSAGSLKIVDGSTYEVAHRVTGLGDLSHASVKFSPDTRYAFIFGRDGALTKVDLVTGEIAARVKQAGNSIGGAICCSGEVVAVANYDPGGVRLFAADDLNPLAEIPATYGPQGEKRSKVVGLVDAPDDRLVFSGYKADTIWVADVADPQNPQVRRFETGDRPYDGLITPGGRYYLAGLYGTDGMGLLDLWHPEEGVQRILAEYAPAQDKRPVYKMPHLEGWALAGDEAYLPAVGRDRVLVYDRDDWQQTDSIGLAGQPVFAMAQPDRRRIWVNFAHPHNDRIQLIDTESHEVVQTLQPGEGVLHMAFTGRGSETWASVRDANKVVVYDTHSLEKLAEIPAESPSGIFFTHRAHKIGL